MVGRRESHSMGNRSEKRGYEVHHAERQWGKSRKALSENTPEESSRTFAGASDEHGRGSSGRPGRRYGVINRGLLPQTDPLFSHVGRTQHTRLHDLLQSTSIQCAGTSSSRN